MTTIERMLGAAIVLTGLLLVGWIGVLHYGAGKYDAGFAAAVKIGNQARDDQAEIYRVTENELRDQLRVKDAAAFTKEKEHAATLEAAQRRMRTGTDSLRCPTRPVPVSAATEDRPAAGGPAPDSGGPSLVPEVAADLLGVAADVGGLVRRYARLEQRFDACETLNAVQ